VLTRGELDVPSPERRPHHGLHVQCTPLLLPDVVRQIRSPLLDCARAPSPVSWSGLFSCAVAVCHRGGRRTRSCRRSHKATAGSGGRGRVSPILNTGTTDRLIPGLAVEGQEVSLPRRERRGGRSPRDEFAAAGNPILTRLRMSVTRWRGPEILRECVMSMNDGRLGELIAEPKDLHTDAFRASADSLGRAQ
jgi:hypothetical protein